MSDYKRNWDIDDTYGCWRWNGLKDDRGYGYLWIKGRNRKWAHRYVWEQERGQELSTEQELDHLCRRKDCVRPEHMEVVTQRENLRRMRWKNRANREKCPAGHGLFENGRRTPEAGIVCLACCGMRKP